MNPEVTTETDQPVCLPGRPQMIWDGPTTIRNTALTFDPGDKLNGSLYLCDPSGGAQQQAVNEAIAVLRGAGLWSGQPFKQVGEDKKAAYEAQLQFVEAVQIGIGGKNLVIARYDHSQFPSSAERFNAWKNILGAES